MASGMPNTTYDETPLESRDTGENLYEDRGETIAQHLPCLRKESSEFTRSFIVPPVHQQLAVERNDRVKTSRPQPMRIDLQNVALLRQDKKRSCAAAIVIGISRGDEVDAVLRTAKATGLSPLAPR